MNGFMVTMLMVDAVFRRVVSEDQYHDVVERLRRYDTDRVPVETERAILHEMGYPESYHPCDHMERIRFCITFGKPDPGLASLLSA